MTAQPPVYYPLMLDLRNRHCLVVGGGAIARRKVDGLLAAKAMVTVVAPTCVEMPLEVRMLLREFESHDLDEVWLVIAATDDTQANRQVAAAATARRIWVNVVDDPQRCTAILPAVVRQGLLCLAISTSGASPVWARRLRDELAAQFGPEYGELAGLLWEARQGWKERVTHLMPAQRKQAWEDVLNLPVLDLIRNSRLSEAKSVICSSLEQAMGEGADASRIHRHSGEM